jgi:HK97 family phage prohead protease
MALEKRISLELRAKGRRLEGYAATFGTEARIGDVFETIAPGAFRDSLAAGRDIVAMVDHDPARVLGRTRSGTLRLEENGNGLAFEIDMPATSLASDVLALAERGDLGGMSFGFTVGRDGQRWDGNRRTLTRINLAEISVVSAWPAYAGTSVQARSRTPALTAARLFLETLR